MADNSINFLIRPVLIDAVGTLFLLAGAWQKWGGANDILPSFLGQPYMAEGCIGIGIALMVIGSQELLAAVRERNTPSRER